MNEIIAYLAPILTTIIALIGWLAPQWKDRKIIRIAWLISLILLGIFAVYSAHNQIQAKKVAQSNEQQSRSDLAKIKENLARKPSLGVTLNDVFVTNGTVRVSATGDKYPLRLGIYNDGNRPASAIKLSVLGLPDNHVVLQSRWKRNPAVTPRDKIESVSQYYWYVWHYTEAVHPSSHITVDPFFINTAFGKRTITFGVQVSCAELDPMIFDVTVEFD